MKRFKEFFKKHNLVAIILVVCIFGLGSGLVGAIIARSYFIDPLFGWPLSGDLDFSKGKYLDQGLVIANAKNVIVQQDAKVDEIIGSVGDSLVGIYKKIVLKDDQQKSAAPNKVFRIENFYKLNESSGQGFILTSDGWIVTSLALVKNYKDYVVITKDKKILEIDKAVADNLTAFNFIHVQAKDLKVRKFAESQAVKDGSLAVAVNWLGLNSVSSVAGFSQSAGLVKSSDSFSEKLALNEKLPVEFKGSIIFNLAGDALGLVNDKGEVEPFSHLTGVIKSLFKNQTAGRPSLGVSYIDLSDLIEVNGQNIYWQKGAIIYKADNVLAVKKNSPAEKAGLREGDIIVSVDGTALDKDHDLTNIIQDHLSGETINLIILRDGVEKEVRIILGDLK